MTDLQKEKLKAALEVAATAFFGAVLTQLEQMLVGGIPPESQWKHDGAMLLIVGLGAVYNRFRSTPQDAIANQSILQSTAVSRRPPMQGFVTFGVLCRLGVVGLGGMCIGLLMHLTACASAGPVIAAVANALPVIEGAVCKIASEQPSDPAWLEDLCMIPMASGPPVAIRVRVPKEQNGAFLALHTADAGTGGAPR